MLNSKIQTDGRTDRHEDRNIYLHWAYFTIMHKNIKKDTKLLCPRFVIFLQYYFGNVERFSKEISRLYLPKTNKD